MPSPSVVYKINTIYPIYKIYMILVALSAITAIFLQFGTILHNKSSENVSFPSYILLIFASASMVLYGIYLKNMSISLVSVFICLGCIFAAIAIWIYRPTSTPGAFFRLR